MDIRQCRSTKNDNRNPSATDTVDRSTSVLAQLRVQPLVMHAPQEGIVLEDCPPHPASNVATTATNWRFTAVHARALSRGSFSCDESYRISDSNKIARARTTVTREIRAALEADRRRSTPINAKPVAFQLMYPVAPVPPTFVAAAWTTSARPAARQVGSASQPPSFLFLPSLSASPALHDSATPFHTLCVYVRENLASKLPRQRTPLPLHPTRHSSL